MGCWHGVVINARTGRVYWLPYSLCCAGFDDEPVDFRLDSKLLIFSDLENKDGGTFFYKLEKDRFVLIHSIKIRRAALRYTRKMHELSDLI